MGCRSQLLCSATVCDRCLKCSELKMSPEKKKKEIKKLDLLPTNLDRNKDPLFCSVSTVKTAKHVDSC